jgi:2-polyprenyl-3-methyl-5-hydroxy-6-metoxy-1,4-benzoquinol methylase
MSGESKLADSCDIAMCYRLFLRREPESQAVIEQHLAARTTVWQLIQSFIQSKEYDPIRIDESCSGIWRLQDGRDIHVEASSTAKAEILAHVEKIWSDYGAEDPYYSVLTNQAYHVSNITPEVAEQFYDSGINGVTNLTLAFERNRMDIDRHWQILELGCGIGRIGEHFCRNFDYYYGIDISSSHLAHAVHRFTQQGITNAEFMRLEDSLQREIDYDLFFSMIVLQHNPPPIMYHLLDRFLAKLKPGGFAFFQLPCHLYGYRFDTDRYLAGQGKRENMEMHALPQKYVFELLHKHGLRPIEVCPFSAIGPIGLSYIFFAQKGSA